MLTRNKLALAFLVTAAAVAIVLAFRLQNSESGLHRSVVPPLKLVLGIVMIPSMGNVILANQAGYFRDEGLDVTFQSYQTGQLAVTDMLAGKIDLALTADTPIALEALKGARFDVLATTYESSGFLMMIGRRDHGIAKGSDLAGKRLGTVFGTTAEYTQDSILAIHSVDPKSVVRVNLAPAHTVDALAAGEVDVVTTWPPHSLELIKRLGDAAVVISDDTVSLTTLNLVSRKGLVKQHPAEMRRMLAAIERANSLARTDPDRAVRNLAQALGTSEPAVKADWVPANFTLALNQSLIIFLEDQARWAIKRGLVEATAVPNFLEWIDADALVAVKPGAVSMIR
jgi:NitT/TauT family transport system substrate-binding protein